MMDHEVDFASFLMCSVIRSFIRIKRRFPPPGIITPTLVCRYHPRNSGNQGQLELLTTQNVT